MTPPGRTAHREAPVQLSEFFELTIPAERRRWLKSNTQLHSRAAANLFYREVLTHVTGDLGRAEKAAAAIAWIAARLHDPFCQAQAARAIAHVWYRRANYVRALDHYRKAIALFRKVGDQVEVGRTLSSALQTLIYLGRYTEALSWSRKARRIFEIHHDELRLARLDSNVGNILYRQDKFKEALSLYHRAEKHLRTVGGPQDIAAALSNIAVCYISLQEFGRAMEAYRSARSWCAQHGLMSLVAEADYNIAYLYYVRGYYARAIELYRAARFESERLGDAYHQALCDLDQSEMYLELNLVEQSAQFARAAYTQFHNLGMRYERAKAQTFLAITAGRRSSVQEAVTHFRNARALFVRERNRVWPAVIDYYCALMWHDEGRIADSRRLAKSALRVFVNRRMRSKAAICNLLLARLDLKAGRNKQALHRCRESLRRLRSAEDSPGIWQIWFVIGQIAERENDQKRALRAYTIAHSHLEKLRTRLCGQEFKIAFLRDKLPVYESLVRLYLEGGPQLRDPVAAFRFIEESKSRSLADLIGSGASIVPALRSPDAGAISRIQRLRERLNWCYREINRDELHSGQPTPRLTRLRRTAGDCEAQLERVLTQVQAGNPEFADVQAGRTISLDCIRSAMPDETLLVEYYQVRDKICVCLVSKEDIEVISLGQASAAKRVLRYLQFQLSKFRLDEEYCRTFATVLRSATDAHLRELYSLLLGPIRNRLTKKHIVFVPNGFLHYLPFHALSDGTRAVCDEFSVSYAPSAGVYYLCRTKAKKFGDHSLVFAIPDETATEMESEGRAVAGILPHSQLYIGAEATASRLASLGSSCRFVHIATHGLYRQESPMFSSIRLGDSVLNVFDLYELSFEAELVTLSGCGTGLNTIVGGDELVGLVRGFLYAGAHSVMVSLWDVDDRATYEFMKVFYRELAGCANSAIALQRTMRKMRTVTPHPYYWAPFELVGDASLSGPLEAASREDMNSK